MSYPHSCRVDPPCIAQVIKCLPAGFLSSLVVLQVLGHFSLTDEHLSAAGSLLNSDSVTQTSGFYPIYEKAVHWPCSLLTCQVCPVEDELVYQCTHQSRVLPATGQLHMASFSLLHNFVEIYSFYTFKWQKGPLSSSYTPSQSVDTTAPATA